MVAVAAMKYIPAQENNIKVGCKVEAGDEVTIRGIVTKIYKDGVKVISSNEPNSLQNSGREAYWFPFEEVYYIIVKST